jgi:4-hydroxybenzoate polyprenyltransferase
LPSGQVSRRFALGLGATLLMAGPALAARSGSLVSLGVASLLSSCVLAYDAGLKRTWLGPQLMGACRGLNLLLGMSQAPALGGPVAWLAAISLAVFVAGVTWISRSETKSGQTTAILVGLALEELGILGLLAAALQPRAFPSPYADRPIVALEGLLVLLLAALAVSIAAARAIREPIPARVQKAVKTGVLALVWLDVGLVMSVRGAAAAFPVALLWLPAFLLGRWLYST